MRAMVGMPLTLEVARADFGTVSSGISHTCAETFPPLIRPSLTLPNIRSNPTQLQLQDLRLDPQRNLG